MSKERDTATDGGTAKRNVTTLDLGQNNRELLLEDCKEHAGASNRAEAIDWAIRMALDHVECLRAAREEIRQLAEDASGEFYRVKAETRLSRDERRR